MKAINFHSKTAPQKANMLLLVISILAVVVLSACGTPQSAPTEAAVEPTAAEAVPAATEAVAETATESAPAPVTEVSYSKDIAPLLQSSCLNCHGGDRTSKGLSVKSYDELMAGSTNGAVIVAGNPEASKLVKVIASGAMPKRGEKLTDSELQLISDWIAAGAPNN